MKKSSFVLQPGKEHFLNILLRAITSSGIEDLHYRHCYYRKENVLNLFSGYTTSKCWLEQSIKKAKESLECVPWYLPHLGNESMCDTWSSRDFSVQMRNLEPDSSCLPDCEAHRFSVELSSVDFR